MLAEVNIQLHFKITTQLDFQLERVRESFYSFISLTQPKINFGTTNYLLIEVIPSCIKKNHKNWLTFNLNQNKHPRVEHPSKIMNIILLHEILTAFQVIRPEIYEIEKNTSSIGKGLINTTIFISKKNIDIIKPIITTATIAKSDIVYVLQLFNTNIFKQPDAIASNIQFCSSIFKVNKISNYLEYLNVSDGSHFYKASDEGLYRLMYYKKDTYVAHRIASSTMAYDLGFAYSSFINNLEEITTEDITPPLPHFHDLVFRYKEFIESLEKGVFLICYICVLMSSTVVYVRVYLSLL